MTCFGRGALVFMVVLILASGLTLGCGSSEENGGAGTIKIGLITDLTGGTSPLTKKTATAIQDATQYFMETDPLAEGLDFEVVLADQKMDDSLNLQLFEFLKDRGCQAIVTTPGATGDQLREPAAAARIPLFSLSVSEYQVDPPAWVFATPGETYKYTKAQLKWVAENDWKDTTRKPRIGAVVWEETYETEQIRAIEAYVAANPGQYQLGPMVTVPLGTYAFTGAIEQVKDCDYVMTPAIGLAPANFIKAFRDRGYTAKLLGGESQAGFLGVIVGASGWDYVDGMLTAGTAIYWTDDYPIVQEAEAAISQFHSGAELADLKSDITWIASFSGHLSIMEILATAAKNKGSADITGQDIYDAAIGFSWDLGTGEQGYSATDRILRETVAVYEWRAEGEDLFRVSDWLPNID